MEVKFWFYVFLFVIFGVPLVGYGVRNLIRFGSFVYQKFPFLRRFFDEYYEHFALGSVICIVGGIVFAILRWAGVV